MAKEREKQKLIYSPAHKNNYNGATFIITAAAFLLPLPPLRCGRRLSFVFIFFEPIFGALNIFPIVDRISLISELALISWVYIIHFWIHFIRLEISS